MGDAGFDNEDFEDDVLDFSSLGLNDVSLETKLPAGTHRVFVADARIEVDAKGRWASFEYEACEGPYSGRTVSERFRANPDDDLHIKIYLKKRLMALGLADGELHRLNLADLDSREYDITVSTGRRSYPTVTAMRMVKGSDA